MHRPLTKSESALAEIGLVFLPGIPAYFWLWPRVADTTWDRSANALVYIYFIVGILFIMGAFIIAITAFLLFLREWIVTNGAG